MSGSNGAQENEGGIRVSSSLMVSILTVVLSVGGSLMLVSRSLGKAEARIEHLEAGLRKAADKESVDKITREIKEQDKRARADHDLLIQIGANLRHIRAKVTPRDP